MFLEQEGLPLSVSLPGDQSSHQGQPNHPPHLRPSKNRKKGTECAICFQKIKKSRIAIM
jgi:hypothetical protein